MAVYNVSRYLQTCLDSLTGQTYSHLEILLIDDGSTDSSGDICESYAAADSRIRVIHQENRGLSAARNIGIEAATSPCLLFIDGDDRMHPEMVGRLVFLLENYDADIAQCQYEEILEAGATGKPTRMSSVTVGTGSQILVYEGKSIIDQLFTHYVSGIVQWNKLFRREIFRKIRYPEGMYHEDEFVIVPELLSCKRLVHTEEELYYYYRRKGSITGMPSLKKRYHGCLGFHTRMQSLEKVGYLEYALLTCRSLSDYIEESLSMEAADRDVWIPRILGIKKQVRRWKRKYFWLPFYLSHRSQLLPLRRLARKIKRRIS